MVWLESKPCSNIFKIISQELRLHWLKSVKQEVQSQVRVCSMCSSKFPTPSQSDSTEPYGEQCKNKPVFHIPQHFPTDLFQPLSMVLFREINRHIVIITSGKNLKKFPPMRLAGAPRPHWEMIFRHLYIPSPLSVPVITHYYQLGRWKLSQ